jgi:hypothetical protein
VENIVVGIGVISAGGQGDAKTEGESSCDLRYIAGTIFKPAKPAITNVKDG